MLQKFTDMLYVSRLQIWKIIVVEFNDAQYLLA